MTHTCGFFLNYQPLFKYQITCETFLSQDKCSYASERIAAKTYQQILVTQKTGTDDTKKSRIDMRGIPERNLHLELQLLGRSQGFILFITKLGYIEPISWFLCPGRKLVLDVGPTGVQRT